MKLEINGKTLETEDLSCAVLTIEDGRKVKGRLSWASHNPDCPAINGIEIGGKIFRLSDEAKDKLCAFLKDSYLNWLEKFLGGRVPVVAVRVGVDYPRLVPALNAPDPHPNSPVSAGNFFLSLGFELGMMEFVPAGVEDGSDITEQYVAECKRRLELRNKKLGETKLEEYYITCWECGRKYSPEEVERLEKSGRGSWDDAGFYCGC